MAIKLRVGRRSPPPEARPAGPWPDGAIFEYDRFGSKIMIYPRHGIWVKDVKGRVVPKSETLPFMRNERGFYYVLANDTEIDKIDMENLIPSTWEEDHKESANA